MSQHSMCMLNDLIVLRKAERIFETFVCMSWLWCLPEPLPPAGVIDLSKMMVFCKC